MTQFHAPVPSLNLPLKLFPAGSEGGPHGCEAKNNLGLKFSDDTLRHCQKQQIYR